MSIKLALVQHNRPGFYVTLVEVPSTFTPSQELQLRYDVAREFEMTDNDGEFLVIENGNVIDRRQIPRF